jgi:hypothetical protein
MMLDRRIQIISGSMTPGEIIEQHKQNPSDGHCSCCRGNCCGDGSTSTVMWSGEHISFTLGLIGLIIVPREEYRYYYDFWLARRPNILGFYADGLQ